MTVRPAGSLEVNGNGGAGMWAPGLVGVTIGLLLLFAVRDSPEQVGFPPVEVVAPKQKDDGSEAPKESLLSLLVNNVLKNPFIWGMALTYFFIYVVRQGVTSWFVFYLIKVGLAVLLCPACACSGCHALLCHQSRKTFPAEYRQNVDVEVL
jgi:sugar phosphate permease